MSIYRRSQMYSPAGKPQTTSVLCKSYPGKAFEKENINANAMHFLWGYRDLVDKSENVPTEPDKVDTSITAKRLAVFSGGSGVTVKYVADDTALAELKKQYGNPVALINGDYESTDGSSFIFTGEQHCSHPLSRQHGQRTESLLSIAMEEWCRAGYISAHRPSSFTSQKAVQTTV